MKKSGILLMITLCSSMLACTYDTITPKEVEVPENVSFNADVIPIFDDDCNSSGCHTSGGIPPDLTPDNAYISLTFFGYVDTDFPEESELYKKIIPSGSMGEYATDQDRAIILKWIEQGALDN
jgi:hypothetical protein